MMFPFLSFLQLSNSASPVLTWLAELITAGAIIDFMVISISATYRIFFLTVRVNFRASIATTSLTLAGFNPIAPGSV